MLDKYRSLKGLIDYAIEKKLSSFKVDGFEFQLSGTDPKQELLTSIQQDVDILKLSVNKLMLKEGLKKVG